MLNKQPVDISFSQGLDLKSDPKRVPIGKFLSLQNSIFTKAGLLQKRNGFAPLTTLPVTDTQFLTTFNDDLTAIGSNIYTYDIPNQSWIDKATLFPCELATLALVRSNTNQSQADSVVSVNGLVCTVYTDQNLTALNAPVYKYVVADATTGQNIISPTQLSEANATYGTPCVFLLGNYFVILYIQNVAGNYHLRYLAVSVNTPSVTVGPHDVATGVTPNNPLSFDAVAVGINLFISYSSGGTQAIKITSLQVGLSPVTPVSFTGYYPSPISVCTDGTYIYTSWCDTNASVTYACVVDQNLNVVLSPFQTSASTYLAITSTASNGTLTQFFENAQTYPDGVTQTHFISYVSASVSPIFHSHFSSGAGTITASMATGLASGDYLVDNTTPANISSGTTFTISGTTLTLSANTAGNSAALPGDALIAVKLGSVTTLKRSVGLASKAFIYNSSSYMLVAYASAYQPTFFLMDSSGDIIAKLAYSNAGSLNLSGGAYLVSLPNFTLTTNVVQLPYLIQDQVTALNKTTAAGATNTLPGLYAQSGVNLVTLTLGTSSVSSSEAAQTLNLSGGFVWSYDGNVAVEQNFFVWPDYVTASWTANSAVTPTGNTTSGSTTITSLSSLTGIAVGMTITGTDIPVGAIVTYVPSSGSTITISIAATGSATGTTFTIQGNVAAQPLGAGTEFTAVGTSTSGSNVITSLSSIMGTIAIGMSITGTDIPSSTTVTGIISDTTIIISKNATGTATDTTFTLTGNTYYYQALFSWSDNNGNRNVSAPSVPVAVNTTGSGNAGAITLNVCTERLTYKTANPIKLEIYRWSTFQQVYYQVTSITLPLLNSTTVDYVTFTDPYSDAAILGNEIIYTTGGVVENISPPATSLITLFQTRLWLVNAEDPNTLWFSKQIIENTPIEMSDLFTYYVSPTIGAQGSTGPITAIAPMDDKLIVWKRDAIYYINGSGPDNTGANNQFSEPTFVSSTIGCANQQSIVFIPNGLMFQSDKGIWLLGRDLSTSYIGAPVETLTQGATVNTALNIPGTTQVRFTMSTGITLMYDYFYGQWSEFVGIDSLSSTLFQSLHTFVNSSGDVYQESVGNYLDGTNPVLMQFTTAWVSLAGLQGFERFYQCYMLGDYMTPFKLNVCLSYDYNPSPTQNQIVTPQAYQPNWGLDPLWGSDPVWGGISQTFSERIFPDRQKCETFQLSVQELYDSTYSTTPGAGLTLSGLNLIVGVKRAYRTQSAGKSS